MKSPKIAVCMVMCLLLMTLSNSCKKSEDEPVILPPGPVIPETTKVIPDSVWNDYIISIDSSDWTLEFDPTLSEQYGIEDGDIIISTLGEGLLRKVTHISEEGGTLIIYTQEGTIVEAMPKGNVKFNIDLTEQLKNAEPSYIAEGVRMAPNQRDGREVMELVFSLEQELHENVTIAGELSFTSSMSGTVAWNGTTLDTLILELNMVENLEITSTIDISSLELKKEITLVTVPLPPITIYAGIPIVIKPVLSLKLGANLEIHSEVSSGVYQELDFTTGFEYINGDITPYCNMEKDLGPIPPELTNTLAAKAFVKPQLDMKIYGFISPNFSMQMYALLEAELGETPWWILYAGLSGESGFNVGIWGFTILNIKVNLFDYKVPVANANVPINNDPVACFIVDPTIGAMGQEFRFDASCSQDEENPLEELQVRWDWEDDGIWDTDYAYQKEATHVFESPGDYTIRMEVIDKDNGTDETSRQVQIEDNHAPEAAFTVDPVSGTTVTNFEFDASSSHDDEDPPEDLKVRWDWDGDGIFDTPYSYDKQIIHQFESENNFTVVLEVMDTDGANSQAFQTVIVNNSGLGNPCPGIETVTYNGQTYNTVLVGNQCWLKENLNIGIRIDGSEDQEDNAVVEKYCYDDDDANCITYGGLYQWDEVMQYVEYEGAQGICPPGWHLPTDDDWKILEGFTDSQYPVGDPEWDNVGWRGSDVSLKLRTLWGWNNNWNGTDDFGFSILPGGRRFAASSFYSLGIYAYFWTSTMRTYDAYSRELNGSGDGIYRSSDGFQYGYSVRCLKDQ